MDEDNKSSENDDKPDDSNDKPTGSKEVPFKKPIFIGKIGRLPKKITSLSTPQILEASTTSVSEPDIIEIASADSTSSSVETTPDSSAACSYKEPVWSGLPNNAGKPYVFEVLKNGSIIETFNLMSQPYWVFGRGKTCSIFMQHPTISRNHAVLQYRKEPTEKEEVGFYIYDLGSTHGTFLNKRRLRPRVYVRVQVGHLLKLGCSSRSFLLTGPDDDVEEESELTVTELKQKRAEEIRQREEAMKEAALRAEKEEAARKKREEERGIDWGLGEDADEESDLTENPYAQTNNEELYLDDPKKALRGFFEREGLDLEYDCTEQGLGQFSCKVELPLDDELGRPIIAEVVHKGKKKEAVVQCALEACRILDRYGVLRQANHESRKKKAKNWEENDYYDSDDDTFLDRTGTVEKKRDMRMKSKVPQKAETYENLVEKEKELSTSINKIQRELSQAQAASSSNENTEEDSLESFMKDLKKPKLDKETVVKLRMELNKLKKDHANVVRLANIAKPASLPALEIPQTSLAGPSKATGSKALPMYGKRKKIKMQLPERPAELPVNSDDEEEDNKMDTKESDVSVSDTNQSPVQSGSSDEEASDGSLNFDPSSSMTFKKFEEILKEGFPPLAAVKHQKLEKILNKLKKLATNEDRMNIDWKVLTAKSRKLKKLISNLTTSEYDEKLEHKVSSELNRIYNEVTIMNEEKLKAINKFKKMGDDLKSISDVLSVDDSVDPQAGTSRVSESLSNDEDEKSEEKRKKKNQRRIQQRQERAEVERQRGYEEDAERDDYNMWVPPSGQSGDGRTSLNDKFGY